MISPDVNAVRHVVDSYLKHETLSGEPHFKNYTRWQPRQVQGQVYISPSLIEGYRKWSQQPNAQINDKTRAFLTKFSIVAQPVTYSLSNEGFGPLHELHVPKNLVLLTAAIAILAGVVVVAMGRGGEIARFDRDLPMTPPRVRGASDLALLQLPIGLFGYQEQATREALDAAARLPVIKARRDDMIRTV